WHLVGPDYGDMIDNEGLHPLNPSLSGSTSEPLFSGLSPPLMCIPLEVPENGELPFVCKELNIKLVDQEEMVSMVPSFVAQPSPVLLSLSIAGWPGGLPPLGSTIVGSVLFAALEEMYPLGEKAETAWALTILGYLAKLVLGILGNVLRIEFRVNHLVRETGIGIFFCYLNLMFPLVIKLIVSGPWVAHIVIYLLIDPPLSSFLNDAFIKLDDIWGLLGTIAFAFFCLYLLVVVIDGAMMFGLGLVFITIHPMNCIFAFLMHGYNVFQIAFVVLVGLTFVYYLAFGWRRKKPSGRFQLE
ncbi:hypothetical protein RJ641_005049, partial [Dillenia turbinata]